MYKINKCIVLGNRFPGRAHVRFVGCGDKCPPRYECKRVEKNDMDEELELIKESMIPPVFKKHKTPNPKLYRNIFCFICVPVLLCVYINHCFFTSKELRRPKFIEFSYLRIRKKEFPWDPVRTLFHNPYVNALPTGYETEVPEENEYDPFEECPK